jgi:hypothetical protein
VVNLGWIGIALLSAIVLGGYTKVVDGTGRGMDLGTLKVGFIAVALRSNLSESLFQSVTAAWIAILNSNDRPSLPVEHAGAEDEDHREQLCFSPLFPGRDSRVEAGGRQWLTVEG